MGLCEQIDRQCSELIKLCTEIQDNITDGNQAQVNRARLFFPIDEAREFEDLLLTAASDE